MSFNDSLEKRQKLTDRVVVQFKTHRLKIFFGVSYRNVSRTFQSGVGKLFKCLVFYRDKHKFFLVLSVFFKIHLFQTSRHH